MPIIIYESMILIIQYSLNLDILGILLQYLVIVMR